MSVVRFPSPETIEKQAQQLRQASMEPEKTLEKAVNRVHEDMETFRWLQERMDERLQSLDARFQSSMERLTQLDLQFKEVESREDQAKKLTDKYEDYIRRLKNLPMKDPSSLSWLRSVDQGSAKQRQAESGQTVSSENSLPGKNETLIDREKALKETIQKLTEVSVVKEKLASQKKAVRIEIEKETAIKDFFMIRIKRIQDSLQTANQVIAAVEKDLGSAEEAKGTAKRLSERLLWLGMKLSQISDAVEELRRNVP